MKYLIFAVLFVSTFSHAVSCHISTTDSSRTLLQINADIERFCNSGFHLDVRMFNSAGSEYHIANYLISLQMSSCDYDTQITHHKNSAFSGFTCIIK